MLSAGWQVLLFEAGIGRKARLKSESTDVAPATLRSLQDIGSSNLALRDIDKLGGSVAGAFLVLERRSDAVCQPAL